MSSPNVFVLGATGYIGGSVLDRFLQRSDIDRSKVTALIRSAEKAAKFSTFGIKTVVGSYKDTDLVEKLSSHADLVLSLADSDDLPALQAILRGLEKRYKETGNVPIIIHTSGTGVLGDNARGEYSTDVVYDDANANQIGTLPLTQIHRELDVALDAADAKGYVKTYIVLPATIYGFASNKFTEAGIQNSRSIQVPKLVEASIARGQAGTVGAGKNLWNNVHIDDVADLYTVLYESIKKNPSGTGHGREGYYFGENGTHVLSDVGKAIAQALSKHGKGTADSIPFNPEEVEKYLGSFGYAALGTNSVAISNRSKSIGWRPKYVTGDFLSSINAEVEASLKSLSH